ncbi:DEAD/DEAH box helicase [Niastella caeni]|uniref:DEAD/DEAH box helicase n=1 Tax=Niastella caeni TaxID=2569763 RepID=A0A4S8HED5_9BACT|nr:DEAD/DEAH box helicase [Niastella caeni]THU33410.1 DEAD/DEAH box helicase [Niastella caeni]
MGHIKDLQEQLLTDERKATIPGLTLHSDEHIVVLKNYRFHKQLTLELYQAPTTQTGKLKNPLKLINPFDAALKAKDLDELKFLTALSRFQNNPTAAKSPADIEALKTVTANPLSLRFFYHNAEFSENVTAGSLKEINIGEPIKDLPLSIRKENEWYFIVPQIQIGNKNFSFSDIEIKYDYFILRGESIHLLSQFHLLKLVRFFKHQPAGLKLHKSEYINIQQNILSKLEDKISVHYTFLEPGNKTQIAQSGLRSSLEKFIYLSDLDNYVLINPVLKYGTVEIPVLTKRQIYIKDSEGEVFAVERDRDAEVNFIALLLKQHEDFEEQLDTDPPHFYLHKQRFLNEDWFLNAFEQWQSQGITVLGFNQLKGNKLNGNKAKITIQVASGLDWFNASLEVRFGKKKASLKQLHISVRNKNKFVKLDDGTQGILPSEWLQKFEDYFNAAEIVDEVLQIPKFNYAEVKQLFQDDELDDTVKKEIALYESKLKQIDLYNEVNIPEELNASLRAYQKQGLTWLNLLDNFNFGGCLADDMGLGKTLQIIAFILGQRKKVQQNTNLVVVPTSLIFNWQAEVQKFAPSLKMLTLYGAGRIKDITAFDNYDIILTSYGTLLSDIAFLTKYRFNYIFLDESQNIKNIESQRYYAARQLQSRNKIAITGTPVENNTFDLYAQLSFACPGLLGNKQSFKDLFSIPIDKFKSSRHARQLQQKVAPFILRRTKRDVARELPEKTEMVLYCPMEEAQRKVYDAYEKEFRDYIAGRSEEELSKNSIHVLRSLTRLRQICDSPLLLEDEKLYGDSSSKIETLIEQIDNKAQNHKVLVFSQFVSMLELIKKELQDRGIAFEYLTGSTKNREAVVNNFQMDPSIRVFLISLKAGGTGLNLTEADYVYLVDPWWNPAVENQAIDRSYRIGQAKNVMAVRLICPDTVEEKIVKLQATKRALSNDLLRSEASFFTSITKAEWLSLLQH